MGVRAYCAGGTLCLMIAACGGAASNASSGIGGGTATLGDPFSCSPVEPGLVAGATMEGMAGRYALAVVLPGNRPQAAEGLLTLRDQPPGLRELAGSSTPLNGFTDLDLEEVSAQRVGDPASDDPSAPGALVIEADGREGRSILIRLGSQANRRDQVAFDGAYTVFRVHRIDGDAFAGSWESGTSDARVSGHFCAMRSGA